LAVALTPMAAASAIVLNRLFIVVPHVNHHY
jgi:hypothetical protein